MLLSNSIYPLPKDSGNQGDARDGDGPESENAEKLFPEMSAMIQVPKEEYLSSKYRAA